MSLDKNNKELIEIYKKTIYSIEKDIKYIKLFNKFVLKKPVICEKEVLALDSNTCINIGSIISTKRKESGRVFAFYNGDTYVGKMVDGKMEGKGSYIFSSEDGGNETAYIGSFKNDLKEGNGMCTLPNGCIYIGQWENDIMSGIGKMSYISGDEYIGNWKNGKKEGHGVYTWKNGGRYIGEFKNGKMDGIGICYDENGRMIYEGQWKNNLAHGEGTYIWEDNKKYTGDFRHGKKHGYGTFYIDNEISYQGSWKFDKPSIFNKSLDEILSKMI